MSGRMDRKDVLKQKLSILKEEHRDLDVAIRAIEERYHCLGPHFWGISTTSSATVSSFETG